MKDADDKRNTLLKKFCTEAGMKWNSRVRYQTDLKRTLSKKKEKKTVMIIDESDERQFKDLDEFYK